MSSSGPSQSQWKNLLIHSHHISLCLTAWEKSMPINTELVVIMPLVWFIIMVFDHLLTVLYINFKDFFS